MEVAERRSAGTVMEQVGHGEKLQAKGNGKNAPCAGETDLIVVSIVMGQAGLNKPGTIRTKKGKGDKN